MLKLSRNADNACRRETAARGAHRERRGASVKRVPRRERRSCNRLVTERRRTRTRPGVVVTETGPGAPGRVRKPGSQFLSVRPSASGFSRSGSRFDRTNHPEPMILIGPARSFKIPCPRTAGIWRLAFCVSPAQTASRRARAGCPETWRHALVSLGFPRKERGRIHLPAPSRWLPVCSE